MDIVGIIKKLCTYKGVEIIEGNIMSNYISIPQKYSVLSFMGDLKEKNSLMIFDMHQTWNISRGIESFEQKDTM